MQTWTWWICMNLFNWPKPGEDSIKCHPFNVFPTASDALSTFLESWTLLQTVLGPRAIGFSKSDVVRRALRRAWHRAGAGAEAWWCRCRDACTHNSRLRSMRSRRMVGLVGTQDDIRPYDYYMTHMTLKPGRGGWQFISNCLCEKHRTVNFMESLMQQVQRFFETDFRPERSATKHGQMPHFMGPILWGILMDTADVPTGCCGSKVWIQWSCSQCHQVNSICSKRRGWVRVKWWCFKKLGYPKSWMVKTC